MKTTLTSAGQITIPIDIRSQLHLVEGTEVYFHIDSIEPVVWISVENKSPYGSKMLSKGQITIPKQIRNRLSIMPGELVKFNRVDESINFERHSEGIPCVFCEEKGNIGVGLPCLVCLGIGQRKIESAMDKLNRLMAKTNRGVGITLKTEVAVIPTVEFFSEKYPEGYLQRCQDYYQWLFYKDYNNASFLDETAIEIISLFKTEEYRNLISQKIKPHNRTFAKSE